MIKQIKFKKAALFFCLILLLFTFARLYYHLTDDFRLGNISYDFSNTPVRQIPDLTIEEYAVLYRLLDQNFYYIGKGSQCYAFASEDGSYVIKFFKFKHLRPNILINLLPNLFPFKTFKENHIERKRKKLIETLNGYDLAFNENRQETQLLYTHLAPTDFLKREVKVIDKLGVVRHISADDVIFLIQKQGVTLEQRLKQLLDADQISEAKHAIEKIIDMYLSRYRKGIFDHDHGVMANTGFVDSTTPFHMDACKFLKDEKMKDCRVYTKDLEIVTRKITEWIKKIYPVYYSEIADFIEEKYQRKAVEKLDSQSIN